jgi:hypothetical protein
LEKALQLEKGLQLAKEKAMDWFAQFEWGLVMGLVTGLSLGALAAILLLRE